MKAYVFPGQGAQAKGMGGALFDSYKELAERADSILGYSLKNLCLENPEEKLSQTQYTQPALYVVSAMTYLRELEENSRLPDFVAGHSIGEYAALYAAGAFDFETGLRLVQYRGQLMAEAHGGGMAAVVGLKAEQVRQVLVDHKLSTLDVANFNSVAQTVISGPKGDIDKAQAVFEGAGATMYITLKVSGAFHSRYMSEAGQKFTDFLSRHNFRAPNIAVVANVDALPYVADKLRENLSKQIVSPVRWVESVRYMLAQGVTEFKEIGPGNVLSGLISRIKSDR